MWFSFIISFFMCIFLTCNDFVNLANYIVFSCTIEHYKLGYKYFRRQPSIPIIDIDPSLEPMSMSLWRSIRLPRSLDRYSPSRYDPSPHSLTATLFGIFVPTCYSQEIKDARWVKAMNI